MSGINSPTQAQLANLYGQYSSSSLVSVLSKTSSSVADSESAEWQGSSSLATSTNDLLQAYTANDPIAWVDSLLAVFQQMGLDAQDSVTFQDLLTRRDEMQKEFQSAVNADLKALGVGLSTEAYTNVRLGRLYDELEVDLEAEGQTISAYTIQADGEGSVVVTADDPELALAVKEWFDSEPARVEELTLAYTPTRSNMLQYRTDLSKNLQETLEAELEAAGLSKDADFHMQAEESGRVVISAIDADVQTTMQNFFDNNPDFALLYSDIENLTDSSAVEFSLVNNGTKIEVVSKHPDADLIQGYFNTNEQAVEMFQAIEALSQLEEARKTQNFNLTEARKRVQMESLSHWFADSGSATSINMAYSESGNTTYAALNTLV